MPILLAVNGNIAVFGHLKWRGGYGQYSPRRLIRGRVMKGKSTPDRKVASERPPSL